MDFKKTLIALLIEEFHRTPEDAEKLVASHIDVVMQGIMGGMNLRATAMALEMKESEEADAKPK